jgi:hypothetical protein
MAEQPLTERGEPGPPARIGQGLAFDPQHQRIVLFGVASEGAGQSFNDVREFGAARGEESASSADQQSAVSSQ